MSVEDLHKKFLADEDLDCHYSTFARLVPQNIIKPKPDDWGTCLCRTCLNAELKLESAKKTMPNVTLTLENLKDKSSENEVKEFCNEIKASRCNFEYVEWTKERCSSNSPSYFS